MPALETQVGQIFINNKKLSRSFISLFSEKVAETGAEIFILAEAALLNPAAGNEYEKILRSIVNIVRRNYKKENENAFENAVAQINDDLAGTAGQGQTGWVGKLNACIAVRQNEKLAVATTGKIHAYLFRDKQFSDIADSNSTKQNPLKAFENFALGKVAKKDFLIFTTNQLFNYISIERLQKILSDLPIGAACKTIADLIKELADESISFGTFVVELGNAKDFSAEETANKALEAIEAKKIFTKVRGTFSGVKSFAAHTMLTAKQTRIPKINIQTATELLRGPIKNQAEQEGVKKLSRAKKFFFAAAVVFIILLAINVFLAVRIHYQKKFTADVNQKLTDIQQKINDANAAYLYDDQKTAADLLSAAKTEFNTLPIGNKDISDQANKISAELTALENSVGHVKSVAVTKLFTYNGAALDSIKLVGNTLYAINLQGGLFVPFSLTDDRQKQDFTVSAPPLSQVIYYNGGFLATDTTGAIYSIDLKTQSAAKQTGSLPAQGIGLAAYGAPARLYSIDKKSNRIMIATENSSPTEYMALNSANPADLAIDGSIYVITPDKIMKFNAKQPKPFNPATSFSAQAKIYTDKTLNYVYVLDPEKNKFMILNKDTGTIVNQYTSDQFQNLKNFTVDEKNRTAYLISGQNILAVKF